MRASKKDKIVAKTPQAGVVLADLAELARSYVAGGFPMWTQMATALPHYIDELEIEHRKKIYQKMMRDPMVRGTINILRMRITENDLSFLPSIDPPTKSKATQADLANYKKAGEVRDFVVRAHGEMYRDPEDVFFEMLLAMPYGHKAAEQVLQTQQGGPDNGSLYMDALEPKPWENYVFITDQSKRLMGLVAAMPGISLTVPTGTGLMYQDLPNFLPVEKWFILTHGGEHLDPRGDSLLNPAYTPWWVKQQTWPQLLRYIIQFAGPSLIGYTPEEKAATGPAQSGQRAQGKGPSPEDTMMAALEMFQSQSIVVLRGGSKLDLIQSTGEGRAHMAAIDAVDRQIVHAIIGQTRSTMESKNGSRADSDSATDILDVVVRWYQGWLQRSYRRQVVKPLVSYEYGVEASRLWTPRPMLREVARPDFAAEATAVANLQSSGYLHPSQYPELDDRLGLPERDMDAVMQEIKQQRANEAMSAQQKGRFMDAGDQDAGDQDDDDMDEAA